MPATHGPHILPKPVIYGFFVLGMVSAVAFRSILILERMEPDWVRPAWYIGVLGYTLFFLYRFGIARKRKAAIERYGLIEKLRTNACLEEEDREVAVYLLSSLMASFEELNYLIIFVLSVVAIAADVVLALL
jgi:hypothetical protein